MNLRLKQKGFTFIELIIVIGVLTTLIGIVVINLMNVQSSASLNTTIDTLVSDIRNQQLKAMAGDAGNGTGPSSYGIFFDTNGYILFKGESYSPLDPGNFRINFADQVEASSTTLPGATIIFSKGSGEVSGFTLGGDSITIENLPAGKQKTIKINQLGVVTYVN